MDYQIELRHYRYFLAVAEELNFRKAADKLYISQPGLTRQIQQMEERLGAKLFERDRKSVHLTEAGKYLEGEIASVFQKLGDIQRSVELIDSGKVGELVIGFLGSAVQSALTGFLTTLNEKYPLIQTSLQEMDNQSQVEGILHGDLDLGFVRINYVPSSIEIMPVHRDTFSVVLPSNHPLDEASFRSIDQLKDERFILFSSDYSPHYYETIVSICEDRGFQPKVAHKSVHAFTIFKMVESGLGVAIVPSILAEGYDLDVKFIPLKKIRQKTTLSAIWRKNNQKPLMKQVLEIIRQDFAVAHHGN